jgi:hypothetical protein
MQPTDCASCFRGPSIERDVKHVSRIRHIRHGQCRIHGMVRQSCAWSFTVDRRSSRNARGRCAHCRGNAPSHRRSNANRRNHRRRSRRQRPRRHLKRHQPVPRRHKTFQIHRYDRIQRHLTGETPPSDTPECTDWYLNDTNPYPNDATHTSRRYPEDTTPMPWWYPEDTSVPE